MDSKPPNQGAGSVFDQIAEMGRPICWIERAGLLVPVDMAEWSQWHTDQMREPTNCIWVAHASLVLAIGRAYLATWFRGLGDQPYASSVRIDFNVGNHFEAEKHFATRAEALQDHVENIHLLSEHRDDT